MDHWPYIRGMFGMSVARPFQRSDGVGAKADEAFIRPGKCLGTSRLPGFCALIAPSRRDTVFCRSRRAAVPASLSDIMASTLLSRRRRVYAITCASGRASAGSCAGRIALHFPSSTLIWVKDFSDCGIYLDKVYEICCRPKRLTNYEYSLHVSFSGPVFLIRISRICHSGTADTPCTCDTTSPFNLRGPLALTGFHPYAYTTSDVRLYSLPETGNRARTHRRKTGGDILSNQCTPEKRSSAL